MRRRTNLWCVDTCNTDMDGLILEIWYRPDKSRQERGVTITRGHPPTFGFCWNLSQLEWPGVEGRGMEESEIVCGG